MNASLRLGLFLFLLCGVAAPAISADAPTNEIAKLRPILQEHCFDCHNGKTKNGGVDLTPFADDSAVLKDFRLWRRVIEQLRTQQMPPDDDAFTPEKRKTVLDGVQQTLGLLDVGSSRVDLQACKLEYSIVSPK